MTSAVECRHLPIATAAAAGGAQAPSVVEQGFRLPQVAAAAFADRDAFWSAVAAADVAAGGGDLVLECVFAMPPRTTPGLAERLAEELVIEIAAGYEVGLDWLVRWRDDHQLELVVRVALRQVGPDGMGSFHQSPSLRRWQGDLSVTWANICSFYGPTAET